MSSRVASLSTWPSLLTMPAVAVVGVLIDAQVGHDDHVVADRFAKVGQSDLDDPVGVPGLASGRVLE